MACTSHSVIEYSSMIDFGAIAIRDRGRNLGRIAGREFFQSKFLLTESTSVYQQLSVHQNFSHSGR